MLATYGRTVVHRYILPSIPVNIKQRRRDKPAFKKYKNLKFDLILNI